MANANPTTEQPMLSPEEGKRIQAAVYDLELLFIALDALADTSIPKGRLSDDTVQEVVIRALCDRGRQLTSDAGEMLDRGGFFDLNWQKGEGSLNHG